MAQQNSNISTVDANVWTTEKVKQLFELIDDGKDVKSTPFYDGKPEWRLGNIVFEYTGLEYEELKKCARDVVYFANNYCYVMTDDGVIKLSEAGGLRDYQEDVLRDYQNNLKCVLMSSRQVGKTICTGIFLAWYLLFNTDKNLMILSNVGATTIEIMDKIKIILANLPFFMKPGIIKNDMMTMKFDNGCRLFGRNTTKTAAIGFAVHFLYVDEMAHIHSNFLDPFWGSVYPTLSSSKIARCILTSTPNGMNLFYDMYMGALEGVNSFKAMRIDWWQVPGRDEAWKEAQIADLGSEEKFNQEFGNQFLSSSSLLLDGKTLTNIRAHTDEYLHREITSLHDSGINYDGLKWHPKIDIDNIKETDRFVISIDTAGGAGGGDFSIINIFKVIPTPISLLDRINNFRDESDFFSVLQVGLFRSNVTPIEDLLVILEAIIYDILGSERIKIVLEMDFKGNLLHEKMAVNKNFYDEMLVHTKHTISSRILKAGVKLNSSNKLEYCEEMRRLMRCGRIITTEKVTFDELSAFGIDKGSYSSQVGHDDVAMSIVNLSVFFGSDQYIEIVEDIYDTLLDKYKVAITKKLEAGELGEEDWKMDISMMRDLMDGGSWTSENTNGNSRDVNNSGGGISKNHSLFGKKGGNNNIQLGF